MLSYKVPTNNSKLSRKLSLFQPISNTDCLYNNLSPDAGKRIKHFAICIKRSLEKSTDTAPQMRLFITVTQFSQRV